jgi:hypothetical protein
MRTLGRVLLALSVAGIAGSAAVFALTANGQHGGLVWAALFAGLCMWAVAGIRFAGPALGPPDDEDDSESARDDRPARPKLHSVLWQQAAGRGRGLLVTAVWLPIALWWGPVLTSWNRGNDRAIYVPISAALFASAAALTIIAARPRPAPLTAPADH